MKGKKVASKNTSTSVPPVQTTESKLVRLLQDDLDWDLNPLGNVQKLLDMLETIDREDGTEKQVKVEALDTPKRDDEALLIDLQTWLNSNSTCSQNEEEVRDWQFASKSIDSVESAADSKGNRFVPEFFGNQLYRR